MSHYKERNYDTHWQMVKKTANLDDDLFKEDLSKKLNEQNKLFKKMMRAFGEDFDELYQAHGINAVEIEKIALIPQHSRFDFQVQVGQDLDSFCLQCGSLCLRNSLA